MATGLEACEAVEVVVAGGGNAALTAAITAREAGARVLLLESESAPWRGGNSKYTRNLRCAHDGIAGGPPYPEEELLEDLVKVTGDGLDQEMARFTIAESRTVPGWLEAHGVRWQPALRGTLGLDRTNRFFLGGGKALVNHQYREAERLGVQVRYGARVEGVRIVAGRPVVQVATGETQISIEAGALVAAAGGFEANLEWLRRYWGDAVDNFVVRGARANDGRVLAALLELGAAPRGNPRGFHAVACDARSPRFEGGIVTRVDAIPFGIVVDREGRRFADEGEDLWPKRYAVWGRLVAERPGQIAYVLYDDRVRGRFIASAYPPVTASTPRELAGRLGLDPDRLERTVEEYNRCVSGGGGEPDPSRLDGRSTTGLSPPKSNWALPLDRPPFGAYPVRPGITFTYLGVGVDRQARVLDQRGEPLPGVFAAGEIMAGNILLHGYLGGFGMTIGTVFGRIAGRSAAAYVGRG